MILNHQLSTLWNSGVSECWVCLFLPRLAERERKKYKNCESLLPLSELGWWLVVEEVMRTDVGCSCVRNPEESRDCPWLCVNECWRSLSAQMVIQVQWYTDGKMLCIIFGFFFCLLLGRNNRMLDRAFLCKFYCCCCSTKQMWVSRTIFTVKPWEKTVWIFS